MKPFLFVVLLLVSLAAQAGPMQPLPIETLATNAEVIVHGTVVSKTVQRDPEGRIFTRVHLTIADVWKGEINPATFSIVYSGGRLGNEETRVSIPISYEIGEEVVAMLRLNHRKEGVTLAAVQGKFVVSQDPSDGSKLVSNVFHGRTEKDERESITDKATPERITLQHLKQLVNGGKTE